MAATTWRVTAPPASFQAFELQKGRCLLRSFQPHLKSRSRKRGAAAKAATLRFFMLPSNMSAS